MSDYICTTATKLTAYAVYGGDYDGTPQWHTGEFDRGVQPCPYVDDWSLAAIWTSHDAVSEWVSEFGGEIVEFEMIRKDVHTHSTTLPIPDQLIPTTTEREMHNG